mgnify:CR=1 FL=1
MAAKRGPWDIRAQKTVYENDWMQVVDHAVIRPGGDPGVYGVVSYKNLALAILPVDAQGHVTLVGQHRFPLDVYSWEIPEGGGRKDGAPLDCARRELKEETGLSAAHWQEILRMDLSNSISDEQAVGFLATGLTPGEPDPEGTEVLSIRAIHFRDALDEAMSGRITDALTVAMLLRAYYMAREGMLDESLATAMLTR